jgi:nitrogen fixation protein
MEDWDREYPIIIMENADSIIGRIFMHEKFDQVRIELENLPDDGHLRYWVTLMIPKDVEEWVAKANPTWEPYLIEDKFKVTKSAALSLIRNAKAMYEELVSPF